MNVWIVSIADPLFYGPLYAELIRRHAARIRGVIVLPPYASTWRSWLSEIGFRLSFWGVAACVHVAKRVLIARLTGRGDFARVARAANVPVRHAADLHDVESMLRQAHAELVLATVTERVPEPMLASAAFGWLNLHCGPLPRYAGVDAPFWCLLEREPLLGVTIHKMAAKFDEGPIVRQQLIPNTGEPYFVQVDRLFRVALGLYDEILLDPNSVTDQLTEQDKSQRSYFPQPKVEHARAYRAQGGRFI